MLNKVFAPVICMQLFAGELTNQNREYYKVNDNIYYSLTRLTNIDSATTILIFLPPMFFFDDQRLNFTHSPSELTSTAAGLVFQLAKVQ